jgi:hypothetical protein
VPGEARGRRHGPILVPIAGLFSLEIGDIYQQYYKIDSGNADKNEWLGVYFEALGQLFCRKRSIYCFPGVLRM